MSSSHWPLSEDGSALSPPLSAVCHVWPSPTPNRPTDCLYLGFRSPSAFFLLHYFWNSWCIPDKAQGKQWRIWKYHSSCPWRVKSRLPRSVVWPSLCDLAGCTSASTLGWTQFCGMLKNKQAKCLYICILFLKIKQTWCPLP